MIDYEKMAEEIESLTLTAPGDRATARKNIARALRASAAEAFEEAAKMTHNCCLADKYKARAADLRREKP